MWGSWFGLTFGGVFVVLLFIGIAFGTSALLFPVIIAAVAMVVIAGIFMIRASARGASEGPGSAPDPVHDAAPAGNEGGPAMHDPRKV
jgi:hypothetical protein